MEKFTYQYPVKQYFGKGCAEEALKKKCLIWAVLSCLPMAAAR